MCLSVGTGRSARRRWGLGDGERRGGAGPQGRITDRGAGQKATGVTGPQADPQEPHGITGGLSRRREATNTTGVLRTPQRGLNRPQILHGDLETTGRPQGSRELGQHRQWAANRANNRSQTDSTTRQIRDHGSDVREVSAKVRSQVTGLRLVPGQLSLARTRWDWLIFHYSRTDLVKEHF